MRCRGRFECARRGGLRGGRPALAHIGAARALIAAGKREEAREAVKQALAVEPDNPDAQELRKELE